MVVPVTLRRGAVSKQLWPEESGVTRDVAVGNTFVLSMSSRAEYLATLLAPQTVRVPVVAE